MPLPRSLSLKSDIYKKLRDAFTKWSEFPDVSSWSSRSNMGMGRISDENKLRLRDTVRSQSTDALRILDQVPKQSAFSTPKRVYIPSLPYRKLVRFTWLTLPGQGCRIKAEIDRD